MPVRRRPSASTVPMAVLTRSTNSSTLWRAAARAAPCTVASCGDVTRAAARGARRATSRGRIESETAGSGRGGTVRCRVDELRTSNRSALVLCTWTVLLFLYPHHIRTSNGFCTYYVPRSSSHNIKSYFIRRPDQSLDHGLEKLCLSFTLQIERLIAKFLLSSGLSEKDVLNCSSKLILYRSVC